MSGVGISFGLDRIYMVLEELGLFPENVTQSSKVLFTNFGEDEALYAFKAMAMLRKKGIHAEFYPDAVKLGKQFQYAEKKGIPYVVIAGEKEEKNRTYNLKNLDSGEQITVNIYELIQTLIQ
jgi:histidyl-tRNA synthetase